MTPTKGKVLNNDTNDSTKLVEQEAKINDKNHETPKTKEYLEFLDKSE